MNKCGGAKRFYGVVTGVGLGALAILGAASPSQAVTFDTGSLGNLVTSGSLAPGWIPEPEVPEPQGPVLVSSPTIGEPEPVAGYLEGQLFYSGPDEQPLTYSATAPAKGSVVMNQDGTFSYQPTVQARNVAASDPSEENLSDAFTVTVSNGIGPDVTVDVVVPISPHNNLPHFVTLEVVSFSSNDSVTTGRVEAYDILDRDTVSLQAEAAKGDVSFAADGITFTYTPTHEARQAADNLDQRTDTITFTATDSYGGTRVETLDVDIAPYGGGHVIEVPDGEYVIEVPPLDGAVNITIPGLGEVPLSEFLNSSMFDDQNVQIVPGVDYPSELAGYLYRVEGDDMVIIDGSGNVVGRTPMAELFDSRPE